MGKTTRPSADSGIDAQSAGTRALDSYIDVLAFLEMSGSSRRQNLPPEQRLPFLDEIEGVESLYRTMSAVAPAVPDDHDEEWNPLSQRPHSPLPPIVADELGAEITSLKEAIDAFSTLTHEMVHVALWEPFFTGVWRPRSKRGFREFSLLSEGFCFFFADIIVSGTVRVRLPDGEFAQERETPGNANFHPVRAFEALGIRDPHEVLDIYLDGFTGRQTPLSHSKNTSAFAVALAKKVHHFYANSLPYLDEMHAALDTFGALKEFFQRFCAIPGLPTFLSPPRASLAREADLKAYFREFFRSGFSGLGQLDPPQTMAIRWRRMLQMRAYYALQVRWCLGEGQVVAPELTKAKLGRLQGRVETYLDGLRELLLKLGREPGGSPLDELRQLDARYEADVRAAFLAHDAWVGHRWLIAPRRAGGSIGVFLKPSAKTHDDKSLLLDTIEFLVEELTSRLPNSDSLAARAETLAQLQQVAALGAAVGQSDAARVRKAARQLRLELARPCFLNIWSVPLSSFDPVKNRYRELLFSYK